MTSDVFSLFFLRRPFLYSFTATVLKKKGCPFSKQFFFASISRVKTTTHYVLRVQGHLLRLPLLTTTCVGAQFYSVIRHLQSCSAKMGQEISQIDSADIQKMLQKFGKLDEDKSGALSAREFMQIPELTSNPLVERVIDVFDSDGNGEVYARESLFLLTHWSAPHCFLGGFQRVHPWFVLMNVGDRQLTILLCLGMNSFASKGDTQHKLRFAFNIYDIGKRLVSSIKWNRSTRERERPSSRNFVSIRSRQGWLYHQCWAFLRSENDGRQQSSRWSAATGRR